MFYKCPSCGELFAADTRPFAKCSACDALLRVSPAEVEVAPAPEAATAVPFSGVAWEGDRTILGAPRRFFLTLRQLIAEAPQFFFSLSDDGAEESARRAERFAYVASFIGLAGFFGSQLWFYSNEPSEAVTLMKLVAETSGRAVRPDGIRRLFGAGLVLTPLLAMLPAHMLAGLYHLSLSIFVRQRRTYDLTFRVVAYGLGPMILFAIPPIGPLLAPGWILALHWIGLAAGHRVPLATALLTLLTPMLTVAVIVLRVLAQLLVLALTQPS